MSTVVWLNDGFVDPARACLPYDDPAVRFGEGVFDSMRAEHGTISLIDRHLERLDRSIAALGLVGMPSLERVRDASLAVAAAVSSDVAKIRATLTPHPTLLVEGTAVTPQALGMERAITIRGAWIPERWFAEHKTLSFLSWRDCQRRASAAGVDTALLLDSEERLGEATTSNVFCVLEGELFTAPVQGLLPGTTRAQIIEREHVHQIAPTKAQWRHAQEIFATSAIKRVSAIVEVDGIPVGDGTPGPLTHRIAASFGA